MPSYIIPSFLFFCFVSSITPGPANLCSLSASLNYGKERALIQWRGLFVGFFIISMLAVFTTYFVGEVLGEYVKYLSYIGATYILWLAWQIFNADNAKGSEARKYCNFYTGLLVNLTNVKVIIYCLTALSAYVLPYSQNFSSLLMVGLFLPFTGPICNLTWLFSGVYLQKIFRRHRKPINAAMALSLVFCALSLVFL